MSAVAVGRHEWLAPTITGVMAPAPDPDSQKAAAQLIRHAQQYLPRFAEAAVMLEEFALALDAGAAQHAAAEADNVRALN